MPQLHHWVMVGNMSHTLPESILPKSTPRAHSERATSPSLLRQGVGATRKAAVLAAIDWRERIHRCGHYPVGIGEI
jgi:hypothetical protein